MKTILILLSVLLAMTPAVASEGKTAKSAVVTTTQAAPPTPVADDEAERLSQRDEEPDKKVAGGALSNEHLTYIVIGLAAAVIVLIAVH